MQPNVIKPGDTFLLEIFLTEVNPESVTTNSRLATIIDLSSVWSYRKVDPGNGIRKAQPMYCFLLTATESLVQINPKIFRIPENNFPLKFSIEQTEILTLMIMHHANSSNNIVKDKVRINTMDPLLFLFDFKFEHKYQTPKKPTREEQIMDHASNTTFSFW